MKPLLIISDGYFHPPALGITKIQKALMKNTPYQIDRIKRISRLKDMDLSDYACLLLYFHKKQHKNTGALIDKILHYSQSGGSVLALHGSTASFKSNPKYVRMTGGRFTGHGKPSKIHITGFMSFDIIDELYEHQLSKDCKILLYGNEKPVYWTRFHMKGKVACLTLGHTRKVYDRVEMMTIIYHALEYLIGELPHERN